MTYFELGNYYSSKLINLYLSYIFNITNLNMNFMKFIFKLKNSNTIIIMIIISFIIIKIIISFILIIFLKIDFNH